MSIETPCDSGQPLTCRVCQSELFTKIVSLPAMPLTDDFVSAKEPGKAEFLHDIHIFECGECGVVQNPFDFNYSAYYRDYQYSSGHSGFAQAFMRRYAGVAIDAFAAANGRQPERVLEIGSGDGAQLRCFIDAGTPQVKGIEPSEYLAGIANQAGIDTELALFDKDILPLGLGPFDICMSSYTFDHVRNPGEYLSVANEMLVQGGILAIEVHDLEKIVQRAEFCLFEHEHTIYLTPDDLRRLAESAGFKVLAINPVPADCVRGNSLIVLAVKVRPAGFVAARKAGGNPALLALNAHIQDLTRRIDQWVCDLPEGASVVGFGAGGRGVMTLAGLQHHGRFKALFDSNYTSNVYLTPKTRIPVVGPEDWSQYKESYCLVFSFGYLGEITQQLIAEGFAPSRIHSLLDYY